MWRLINFVVALILSFSTIFAGQLETLVNGNNEFSFDAYNQLRKQNGNLFFSPYSISSAFAMTAVGAKGQTAKEMMFVFNFSPDLFPSYNVLNKKLITASQPREASPTLQIANAIWPQKGLPLLDSYKNAIQNDFGSTIESVDFAQNTPTAIKNINSWVSDKTKGKIQNLLSSSDVTSETKMILTSAIYMKATWMNVFEDFGTQNMPFYLDAQNTVEVPMMQNTEFFYLFEDDKVAVIKMPYAYETQGPALVMIVALPKAVEGLSKLEENLSMAQWNDWLTKGSRRRVHLTFPKFRIENRMSLNDIMQALGLKQAFTTRADFSGITGKPDLYISEAIHQTYIDVDEKGTEAAAVTAIGMRATSIMIPDELYEFTADHPFLFLIMDQKTQTILFMGRFVKG